MREHHSSKGFVAENPLTERLMRFSACWNAIAFFAIAIPTIAQAADINVFVNGLHNNDGVIRCYLFHSPDGFRKPERKMSEAIGEINNGHASCVFTSLLTGTYAVEVFHADKNESKIIFGPFGRPVEGIGFSRNPLNAFGQPSFTEASFDLGEAPQNLQITLAY